MRAVPRTGCAIAACLLHVNLCFATELPSPLSLRELLAQVRERSPRLEARRGAAQAARASIRGTGVLDDPTLSLEWWQQPVDFSSIPLMLSLRQPIAWPGRLRARRTLAERAATLEGVRVDEVAREIEADAKRAYLDLLFAERGRAVNEQVRVLLQAMVTVADVKYRVGTATQVDVLRVQSELLTLENERLEIDLKGDEARARLNALLDRPGDATLPPLSGDLEQTKAPSASDAIAEALRRQPAVLSARAALAEAEARLALARHEADPELAVWAGYMVNVRGVDTFTAGVSSTLPVFSARRRSAAVRAQEAEVQARRAELRAAERRAEVEVRTTLLQVEAAARHARLHAERLIPVADVALKSAEAAYQNNRIDLLSVLDAARMVRDHHFNHARYLVEHQRLLADLARLTGATEVDR